MRKTVFALFLLSTVLLAGCTAKEKPEETMESTTTTIEEVTTTVEETTTEQSTTSTSEAQTTTSTSETSSTIAGFCFSDGDCPQAFNTSTYCWDGGDDKNMYMDEVEYVCSGKGTASARCVEVHNRLVAGRCTASKCLLGGCYPTHCFNRELDKMEDAIDCGIECPDCELTENITCFSDCDCLSREGQLTGTYYRNCEKGQISASELIAEEARCHDYTIYQKLITYRCIKAGTTKSSCTSTYTQDMITASCRNKNCTLDCVFKTMTYPNLAVINKVNVSFASIG